MKKINTPHLLNFLNDGLIEAGCDEAGRGPLAGPVFAAAVILPTDFYHPLLNDSKKMTAVASNCQPGEEVSDTGSYYPVCSSGYSGYSI